MGGLVSNEEPGLQGWFGLPPNSARLLQVAYQATVDTGLHTSCLRVKHYFCRLKSRNPPATQPAMNDGTPTSAARVPARSQNVIVIP